MGRAWVSFVMILIRKVLKITYSVENAELIKNHATPIIIAVKHQSMWESFALVHEFCENTTFITKKEVLIYPGVKALTKAFDMIVINRSDAMEAIKQLIKDGKDLYARGINILIFPEGTRVKPGAPTEYKRGVYFLYKALNIPVVTVALNSGLFWPGKTFVKKKGHITVKVTGIIDPGLNKDVFQEKIIKMIEEPSLELITKSTEEKA